MTMAIVTTGGTIDKVYFDANSSFQVGAPQIGELLREANVAFDFEVVPLLRKDSLELTDADRQLIRTRVAALTCDQVLVTHGTDTMVQTAQALLDIPGKTIVLTGAMQPARLRHSDAIFNIGFAVAATQTLPPGVYLAMNGRIFDPRRTRKNLEQQRFEEV